MTPQSTAGATFGVGVLGSLVSGFGQYESGQQQKSADDYNADITLDNMKNQMVANTEKFSALVGRQGAGYAASGVDIASGSPLLVMAATAARGAQQGEQIEQAGTEEAALQRYYGKIAAWGGTMGGIGTFLSGLTKSAASYNAATASPSPSSGVPTVPGAMFGPLFSGGS
jgi:hypothetical protein